MHSAHNATDEWLKTKTKAMRWIHIYMIIYRSIVSGHLATRNTYNVRALISILNNFSSLYYYSNFVIFVVPSVCIHCSVFTVIQISLNWAATECRVSLSHSVSTNTQFCISNLNWWKTMCRTRTTDEKNMKFCNVLLTKVNLIHAVNSVVQLTMLQQLHGTQWRYDFGRSVWLSDYSYEIAES